MRKSKLIEQNALLFEETEKLRKEISDLKKELAVARSEAASLKAEKEQKPEAEAVKSPIKMVEEKVIEHNGDDSTEYGSKAIGKIIIAVSEMLTELQKSEIPFSAQRKDLVLGRAESAKEEILKIVSGEEPDKDKKTKVDDIVDKTLDYFKNMRVSKK